MKKFQRSMNPQEIIQNLHYESPSESPRSDKNTFMRTKLNSLFNNLEYFEKQGRKLIKRSFDRVDKRQNYNIKNYKRSLALVKNKQKIQNRFRYKQDSLPILHMSEVKLIQPKSPILLFENKEFYPTKSISRHKITSSSQYQQYQKLINILKLHNQTSVQQIQNNNKFSSSKQTYSIKGQRPQKSEQESFRSTSMFFKTKKTNSSKLIYPQKRKRSNITSMRNY